MNEEFVYPNQVNKAYVKMPGQSLVLLFQIVLSMSRIIKN